MKLKRQLKNIEDSTKIDSALDDVKNGWLKKFDRLTVNTPDEALNLMVNKWLEVSGNLWKIVGTHSLLPAKWCFWF